VVEDEVGGSEVVVEVELVGLADVELLVLADVEELELDVGGT
jgi:hypothetical protein